MGRRDFIVGAAAFAVSPLLAADGQPIKTPLMLDTKRMVVYGGPGIRTTALGLKDTMPRR